MSHAHSCVDAQAEPNKAVSVAYMQEQVLNQEIFLYKVQKQGLQAVVETGIVETVVGRDCVSKLWKENASCLIVEISSEEY